MEIIPNWHPIFVHFTIALLCTSLLFMLLKWIYPKPPYVEQWRAVARWTLWLGGAITLVTVFTGWLAFNSVAHDDVSHRAMLEHRNWALTTFVLIETLTVWSIIRCLRRQHLGYGFLALMILTVGMVGSTAWHGAELVYRHGLGVMSLPDTGQHAHGDHAHGHATELEDMAIEADTLDEFIPHKHD